MTEDFQIEDLLFQSPQRIVYRAKGPEDQIYTITRLKYASEVLQQLSQTRFARSLVELKKLSSTCLRPVIDGGLDPVDHSPWIATVAWPGERLMTRMQTGAITPEVLFHLERDASATLHDLAEEMGTVSFDPDDIVATQTADGQTVESFVIDYFQWFRDWANRRQAGGSEDPAGDLYALLTQLNPQYRKPAPRTTSSLGGEASPRLLTPGAPAPVSTPGAVVTPPPVVTPVSTPVSAPVAQATPVLKRANTGGGLKPAGQPTIDASRRLSARAAKAKAPETGAGGMPLPVGPSVGAVSTPALDQVRTPLPPTASSSKAPLIITVLLAVLAVSGAGLYFLNQRGVENAAALTEAEPKKRANTDREMTDPDSVKDSGITSGGGALALAHKSPSKGLIKESSLSSAVSEPTAPRAQIAMSGADELGSPDDFPRYTLKDEKLLYEMEGAKIYFKGVVKQVITHGDNTYLKFKLSKPQVAARVNFKGVTDPNLTMEVVQAMEGKMIQVLGRVRIEPQGELHRLVINFNSRERLTLVATDQ